MAKTLKVFDPWSQETYQCWISVGTYHYGGTPALSLWSENGPYSNITTNLVGYECAEGCVLLDTNNMPEICGLLYSNGLAVETGRVAYSGWCAYPEFMLNWPAIAEYTDDDVSGYVAMFNAKKCKELEFECEVYDPEEEEGEA